MDSILGNLLPKPSPETKAVKNRDESEKVIPFLNSIASPILCRKPKFGLYQIILFWGGGRDKEGKQREGKGKITVVSPFKSVKNLSLGIIQKTKKDWIILKTYLSQYVIQSSQFHKPYSVFLPQLQFRDR